jgi:hypothetical protein
MGIPETKRDFSTLPVHPRSALQDIMKETIQTIQTILHPAQAYLDPLLVPPGARTQKGPASRLMAQQRATCLLCYNPRAFQKGEFRVIISPTRARWPVAFPLASSPRLTCRPRSRCRSHTSFKVSSSTRPLEKQPNLNHQLSRKPIQHSTGRVDDQIMTCLWSLSTPYIGA